MLQTRFTRAPVNVTDELLDMSILLEWDKKDLSRDEATSDENKSYIY